MNHYEKRRFSRHTIRDDVMLVLKGGAGSELCILENLSRSGVKFLSTKQLAVGSRVELRIPSSNNEPEIVIHANILRAEQGNHSKPFCYACMIEMIENF